MIPAFPDDPVGLFFALLVVHALADFPLQGSYLARQKVRASADGTVEWVVALIAHSLIHAGAVWLITGSRVLAVTEFILHALIDSGAGKKRLSMWADQSLHVVCKLIYVVVIALGWVTLT